MKVLRIVANIAAARVADAERFYHAFLGLERVMDLGWIVTYAADAQMSPQVSFATQGGAGTAVPDISIEVDDVNEAYRRARDLGYTVEYGPLSESWGVRRFYVRDPFGRLVNIVAHESVDQP